MVNTGSIWQSPFLRQQPRAPDELTRQEEEQESSAAPRLDEVAAQVLQEPQHKGRLGEALVCGPGIVSERSRVKDSSRAGTRLYICRSGTKKVRIVHQLGRCYILPSVDYMDYTSAGIVVPKNSEFDGVCRLCAREGLQDGEDSSATVSSSSPLMVPAEPCGSTVA